MQNEPGACSGSKTPCVYRPLTCNQAVRLPFCLEDEGKRTPEILLYPSSARSPESGLLSDWLKNKRSFGALHWLVTSNISDFWCNYIGFVTFVSSWQKPQDDQGILLTASKARSFKKKKMNTFLVNQNNNTQRKTLTADEDELLFVTSKDICYFSFDAFLLRPGRCKKIIIDDFTPALLQTDERPWKICCCRINFYTFNIFQ